MQNVAIYMRVSSDKQVQEGDSIPAQRDALRKYIDSHDDMVCAGEYCDDGVSGTRADRDELQRMLDDVCAGKVDLILVTKLDRIYRSIRHYLNFQDTIDRHHANWLAIWEPIYDTTTPQGRLVINQMMSIAQFEAENTGQRIRQVQAYKVSKGEVISGSTPPGFKIAGKHLVPDENAETVRKAFEFYSRCGNMDATMREFKHFHVFPSTKSAWKKILANSKYIGVMRGNGSFCEPIVPKDVFDDVQRKLAINVKKSQKHTYIFSGLLRCAECGGAMGGVFRRQKRGKEINEKSYRCHKHYNGGISRCTNAKVMHEHILESYLLEHVRQELRHIVFTAETAPAPATDNTKKIAALQKRQAKMKELFVNDLLTIDEYKQEKNAIDTEMAALAAVQPPEQPDLTVVEQFLAVPFEDTYGTFSEDQKRFFWRSVIKEIRFDINRSIKVTYLP